MVPSWLKMSVNLLIAELGAGLSSWESDRRGQSGGVVRRKKGSDRRDLKGWRIQSGLLWDENQGVLDSQTEIVSEHLSDLLGEWVEWSFCTGRERKHSCSSQFWRFLFFLVRMNERPSHLDDAFTLYFFLSLVNLETTSFWVVMVFCFKSLGCVSFVSCLLEFASDHVFLFWTVSVSTFFISQYSVFSLWFIICVREGRKNRHYGHRRLSLTSVNPSVSTSNSLIC